MSSTGQSETGIYTHEFAMVQAREWSDHDHGWHELLWGTRGTLTAETDDGFFAVAAHQGLWIPARVVHRVTAASGTTFFCSYLRPDLAAHLTRTTTVDVSRLLAELLAELGRDGFDPPVRDQAERLVPPLLVPVAHPRLDVTSPLDDRARRVARALLADPADPRSLAEWGRLVGASERNLSRIFRAETGRSFVGWRTDVRMRAAVELLVAGVPVGSVARRVGYGHSSAFVHAFRLRFGCTPGAFTATGGDAEVDRYTRSG
ncbi:AraC family transcriptional regulator [Nakamurella sp.]|uniref:helix-turn-helix transcriptional regulator n=1 Tax=Nakamurella sp. TaxID=1869182 RepID=UPI003B3B8D17